MSKISAYFKKNLIPTVIISTMSVTFLLGVLFVDGYIKVPNMIGKSYVMKIYHDNATLAYEGARAELVSNIDSIIRKIAPSSCMNGIAILRGCEKYDVDLFFVLAQGQLESHYGTKGVARKTNSVFNVYAYDKLHTSKINKNGKYSHPDLSIEPYLRLLKNQYLSNGKTEKDLLINYVNIRGERYASNISYEDSLLSLYNKFLEDKVLQKSYDKYNKYKILSGN